MTMRSINARTKPGVCCDCGAKSDMPRCLLCVRRVEAYRALAEALTGDEGPGWRLDGSTGCCSRCGRRGCFCDRG